MHLVFYSEPSYDECPGMTVADCYCNFIVRNRLVSGDVYAAVVQRVYVTYLQHLRNVLQCELWRRGGEQREKSLLC